ncbi:MAG TPA: HD domain-containing phosphohydrolase [Burkholderiales bacterium]|nr:HD domain-containing phosphohydrolase [Burkholderiales bacterium]
MNNGVEALNHRLGSVHDQVREYFPFVVRIAVALYDPKTDDIKTFLHSPSEGSPLTHYSTKLAGAGWLDELRRSRRSRVIDALESSVLGDQPHSLRIGAAGYKASYTVPVFDESSFLGFVFFNTDESHVFTERITRQLDLFVRIISLMIESALRSVNILVGGLHLLREISRFRDDETSSHLSRMSYYSELIARRIAANIGRDDDWVEHLRLFAPLHDIGKIATPDTILFKPDKLTEVESGVMRQHAAKGAAILIALIQSLSLEQVPHIDSLLNIARHHHERWDGKGYPDGLSGEHIPPEARIVKVADVFDALTSRRCYKPAWPPEKAAAFLRERAGIEFDARCVEALLSRNDEIVGIMQRFAEESSEATG